MRSLFVFVLLAFASVATRADARPKVTATKQLVGEWQGDAKTYRVAPNGTFTLTMKDGKPARTGRWKIVDGDVLEITLDQGAVAYVRIHGFSATKTKTTLVLGQGVYDYTSLFDSKCPCETFYRLSA